MATLSILFSGISCQFHGVVPGVPMRAVLPNASAVRFGMVNVPDDRVVPPIDRWVDYYLMPHVPFVTDGTTPKMLAGAHLQVLNPSTDQGFSFVPGDGYSLTRFVKDFAFSEDVVLNGNAACYFDVFYGKATTVGSGVAARSTLVTMETDGPPLLKITPFPGSPMAIDETPWEISEGNLWVSNIDYDASTEDRPFDFLLNYLVARGGIPKQLRQLTPGLINPTDSTMEDIGDELIRLGAFIANGGRLTQDKLRKLAMRPVPLNESCSDSHFP